MACVTLYDGAPVWAQMKGHPPWPALIVRPPPISQRKPHKDCEWVYFFGTENYGWVRFKGIKTYAEYERDHYHPRSKKLLKAVSDIEEHMEKLKSDPTYKLELPALKEYNQETESNSHSCRSKSKKQRKEMSEGSKRINEKIFQDLCWPIELSQDPETGDIIRTATFEVGANGELIENFKHFPPETNYVIDSEIKSDIVADNEEHDEFEYFGRSIAVQLRKMPLERALICQEKLLNVLKTERLFNQRAHEASDGEAKQ